MKRSLMQIYVRGSVEAVAFYQRAFDAPLVASYRDADGAFMHAEIDIEGQILAVAEASGKAAGNNMQFCLQFGAGKEDVVRRAYEVLAEGAAVDWALGPCDYSPLMVSLIDRFGIYWCLFI